MERSIKGTGREGGREITCIYTLNRSLVNIRKSESEEELELLALSFTASQSHFGSVKTVELDQGGKNKAVTLENKQEFVQKLYFWYLTGEQKTAIIFSYIIITGC